MKKRKKRKQRRIDIEGLTKAELIEMCKDRGISVNGKMSKADIIEKLR